MVTSGSARILKSGGHEEVIVQVKRGEWRIEKALRRLWRFLRRRSTAPALLLIGFFLLMPGVIKAQSNLSTNTPLPARTTAAPTADFFTKPALCSNNDTYNCLSFYDPNVTISKIQSLASVPVYQNPLLQVELTINTPPNSPAQTILYLDSLREFGRGNGHFCPLLIAGITTASNNYTYATYTVVPTGSGSTLQVQLYAYCKTPGLPNSVLSFPVNSQALYSDANTISQNFTDLTSGEISQYKTALDPQRTSACHVDYFDLLLQLALYRIAQPDLNFYQAGIPLFDRYQADSTATQSEGAQMDCLLKDTGVPDFTQTPAPTATAIGIVNTPTLTPTPTSVPIMDGVVASLPGDNTPLTLGQLILGLMVIAVGVVALLALPALPRPALRLLILIAVVIAAVLIAFFLIRRANAQDSSLPQTNSPPLLLLILLDNSSTMTGTNSAATTKRYSTPRDPTDSSDRRAQAVQRLLLHLQADSVQHQVAVLSFGSTPIDLRGLSIDDTGNFGFVGVGGGGSADTLIQAVMTPRTPTPGPGDVKGALAMAKQILQPQLDKGAASVYKPVILLITDDVPMDTKFAASVWSQSPNTTKLWSTYVQGLETDMQSFANEKLYQGYCRPANGGVSFGVFAMGAANWVNTDGSINSSGNGSFYSELLTNLGSIAPLTKQPLNYRIDPTFTSDGQLVNDFRDAIPQFLRDVRCEWDVPELVPETDTARAKLSIPVSVLYQSVTLTLDVPHGAQPTVTLADKSALQPLTTTAWGNNQDTLVYFAEPKTAGYAGSWQVLLNGVGSVQLGVQINAAVDLSALTLGSQTDVKSITSANNSPYSFQLLANGVPVDAASDPVLGANPSGSLTGQGIQPVPIVFRANSNGQYSGTIPKASIANPDHYHLSLGLTTKNPFLVNDAPLQSFSLTLADFTVGSSFSVGEVKPVAGICGAARQNCRMGAAVKAYRCRLMSVRPMTAAHAPRRCARACTSSLRFRFTIRPWKKAISRPHPPLP